MHAACRSRVRHRSTSRAAGPPGASSKGEGRLTLEEQEGGTLATIKAEAQVGGLIARRRASALVGAAGRMLMSQFFSALEAELDKSATA